MEVGSVEAEWSQAIWILLWAPDSGAVDRALAILDEILDRDPTLGEIRWTRIAARLVRAELAGSPVDALQALDEIVWLESESRAVLDPRARAIAEDLLALPGSRGCDEAAAGTCSRSSNGGTRPATDYLEVSDGNLVEAVAGDPQGAREWVFERALPKWGAAVAAGDARSADPLIERARTVARALAVHSGDLSASIAVESVDRGSVSDLRHLARGFAALGRGRALFDELEIDAAQKELRVAERELRAGRSEAAFWAELWLAGCEIYRGNLTGAIAGFRSITEKAGEARALRARAQWGTALSLGRQGDLVGAEAFLADAIAILTELDERENLGAVLSLQGDVYRALGESELAWRSATASLRRLRATQDSHWLGMTLSGAVQHARDLELPRAAFALSELWIRSLDSGVDRTLRVPAHLMRAAVAAELGDDETASRELAVAKSLIVEETDATTRDSLLIDLDLVTSRVARRRDPHAAIAAAERAFTASSPKSDRIRHFEARQRSAEAKALSGDLAGARRDLERALGVASWPRHERPQREETREAFESRQLLVDTLLELLVERPEWRPSALARLEAELAAVPGDVDSEGDDWERRMAHRSTGAAILRMASLPRSLAVWLWSDGVTCFDRVPLGRAEIELLVARTVESLDDGAAWSEGEPKPSILGGLLGHCRDRLPTEGRLAIVADRGLSALPFAALSHPATARPLVELLTIDRVKRLAELEAWPPLRTATTTPRGWSALVVGISAPRSFGRLELPALEEAEREAAEIGAVYPGSISLLGGLATGERIVSGLGGRDVFHFAGHSVGIGGDPNQARLILGGNVASPEVFDPRGLIGAANRAPRLVVLSSCSSGLLDGRLAGAANSLVGAFERAGVQVFVGSLWSVEDAASRALLRRFHQRVEEGWDGAAALRDAQLMAREGDGDRTMRPSNWAAFQIWGILPANSAEKGRGDG